MPELGACLGRLFSAEETVASVRSYRPLPSDIVISPFGESGTTWIQHTFHTLRTGGDMSFDDICRVVPWVETAAALGLDLEAPQPAAPRGFKSHMTFEQIPKGARYVVALRDPRDALVSRYRHYEGWLLEPGALPMTEFVRLALRAAWRRPDIHEVWQHIVSWWRQRDNPDVLLVTYEAMCADPAAFVRRLAAFCAIPLDDKLLALTLERTSIEFMRRHRDRFDDLLLRRLSEERCNLPPGGDASKVRGGGVGRHKQELPHEFAAAFDVVWKKIVTPEIGFPAYESFRVELDGRGAPYLPGGAGEPARR
jgi:hypothetical protein